MNDTYMADFEPEYSKVYDDRVIVVIGKNGGGTVGKEYTQEVWSYLVLIVDGCAVYRVARGNDLYIGKPATHEAAADTVHTWFNEGDI